VNGVALTGRDAFWSLLANRRVIAHFNGHTHTYSSRLVKGDGTRQHDNLNAYGKTGQQFDVSAGVWGVESGQVHNSAGAAYVLTTVRDNVVTFDGYDQIGTTEPFKLIETWSVKVGNTVNVTSPLAGGTFPAPASITVSAQTSEPVAQVAFYAGATQIGIVTTSPYQIQWTNIAAGNYQLTAIATDTAGGTSSSAPVNISVTAPPSAPTGLTATAGDQQVSLMWTASTGATSYTVSRATTNGGPYSQIASGITATTYLNTGLTNGTTYYYVVTAVNSTGASGNSNQVNATPQLSTGSPGIAFVRETGKKRTNSSASVNGSFSTRPSIGNNIIVVAWAWVNASSGVALSASDNQGHTYAKVVERTHPMAGGTIVASIFVARVTASSGTFTVTVRAAGGTSRQLVFDAREYSGMLNPAPVDKSSSSQGTANNVDTLATAITAEANELVVAVGVDSTGSSSTSWTINRPGSNPTNFASIVSEPDDNNYMAGNAVEVLIPSTGSVRHIWTTTPATTGWAAVIASFRRQP